MTRPVGDILAGVRCTLVGLDAHFMSVGCDDCDARRLARTSLDRVEQWYRYGNIRQEVYEAFMHCWATGAVRFSTLGHGWETPPTDPHVVALVALIREAAA